VRRKASLRTDPSQDPLWWCHRLPRRDRQGCGV